MKKFIPLLLAVFAFVACEQDPNLDKLDDDYMVYTNYDKSFTFNSASTYYMPDSICVIGGSSSKATYLQASTSAFAKAIIDEFQTNMASRNFTLLDEADKDNADLLLTVDYVESIYNINNYGGSSWWWDYPGYWSPSYWGNWGGGWYYPYVISYSFTTGTVMANLANATSTEGTSSKLPIVWTSIMSGLLGNSSTQNLDLIETAINQAFIQSA